MSDQINLLEAEAEAGAELAGEISGGNLEEKFLQLESGGVGSDDEALEELIAKIGLLEGGSTETKQLEASNEPGQSLSAEDLKELEELDLSGVDLEDLSAKPEADKDATAE